MSLDSYGDTDDTDVGFDGMKFLALERFMARLHEADCADRDVDELQIDFMVRCDRVLLSTVAGFVTQREVEEVQDSELREHLASQLDLALEEAVSLPALVDESLDLLEQMEDVTESWLSVLLFDSDRLNILYGALEALPGDFSEDTPTHALRELMMELVYRSPLLSGEDWIRFRLMIEHMENEAFVWVLNRFLNGHLEYIRVLQARCLERYPELARRVRQRLFREAGLFAKRLA